MKKDKNAGWKQAPEMDWCSYCATWISWPYQHACTYDSGKYSEAEYWERYHEGKRIMSRAALKETQRRQ